MTQITGPGMRMGGAGLSRFNSRFAVKFVKLHQATRQRTSGYKSTTPRHSNRVAISFIGASGLFGHVAFSCISHLVPLFPNGFPTYKFTNTNPTPITKADPNRITTQSAMDLRCLRPQCRLHVHSQKDGQLPFSEKENPVSYSSLPCLTTN